MSATDAAKAEYFVLSAQINQTQDQIFGTKSIPWKKMPAVCAAWAPALEAFANDIANYNWPADAKDEADAMVSTNAAVIGLYYQCAKAPGTASGQGALNGQIVAAENVAFAAASTFRLALGLPINR